MRTPLLILATVLCLGLAGCGGARVSDAQVAEIEKVLLRETKLMPLLKQHRPQDYAEALNAAAQVPPNQDARAYFADVKDVTIASFRLNYLVPVSLPQAPIAALDAVTRSLIDLFRVMGTTNPSLCRLMMSQGRVSQNWLDGRAFALESKDVQTGLETVRSQFRAVYFAFSDAMAAALLLSQIQPVQRGPLSPADIEIVNQIYQGYSRDLDPAMTDNPTQSSRSDGQHCTDLIKFTELALQISTATKGRSYVLVFVDKEKS